LATIINNQAKDIQKQTKWNYASSFMKAIETFFGGCPVSSKNSMSDSYTNVEFLKKIYN